MSVKARNLFAVLPEWVLYADVSAQAVRLYCVLYRRADKDSRKATPGRALLARTLHCSPDTVDRALRELEAIGAIEITRRWKDRERRVRLPNEYVVVTEDPGRTDAATPVHTPTEVAAETPPPSRADAPTPGRTDAAGTTESQIPRVSTDKVAAPPLEAVGVVVREGEPSVGVVRSRPRNELFDALARVTGCDPGEMTDDDRRACGVALAKIRAVAPELTAAELERRAVNYQTHFGDAALTPSALARRWAVSARPKIRTANDRAAAIVAGAIGR